MSFLDLYRSWAITILGELDKCVDNTSKIEYLAMQLYRSAESKNEEKHRYWEQGFDKGQ